MESGVSVLRTYQDWLAAGDRAAFLLDAVKAYRLSPFFRHALEAQRYFRGENPRVAEKTILRAGKITVRDENGIAHTRAALNDVVGNRVGSAFFFRFVCQQNQYLLQNGCQLAPGLKERLGADFDRKLAEMGEKALVQGVCWGFFNADHLEVLEAARDSLSGFFALPDEETGAYRVGVQFWQAEARRPMFLRLFEEDGLTVYRCVPGGLALVRPKTAYLRVVREGTAHPANWRALPVLPLRANPEARSELTPAIRAKIDAYDCILSDFADNLERANEVYWVLNNFGGTAEDIAATLEQISRLKAAVSYTDGSGADASAEPRTIEVPYAARSAALELLRKALYDDFMALDTCKLSGGSLTNVAIRAARADLDLKTDRWEWQVFRFVQELLALTGTKTDAIRFQRQQIADDTETIANIYRMRADIDRATALRLNPLIQPEEAESLVRRGKEDAPWNGSC